MINLTPNHHKDRIQIPPTAKDKKEWENVEFITDY